jgi:hypothetical protein
MNNKIIKMFEIYSDRIITIIDKKKRTTGKKKLR